MELSLQVVAPVFAVVLLGYGATFTPLFRQEHSKALADFVFNFALPLLLLQSLASRDLPEGNALWLFLAFFGGAGLNAAFTVAALLLRAKFAREDPPGLGEATMLTFAGTYSNTVLLGIPLVLRAYGDDATLPMFLIISVHGVSFFTVVTACVEAGRGGRGLRRLPVNAAKGLATNPIFVGLAVGLALNLTGTRLPAVADEAAGLIGQAALPCALFSLGVSMRGWRLRGALPTALLLSFAKLLVQPAMVWILAGPVLDLPGLWLNTAVLLAAMPTGVNVYLFAARYRLAEAECATAVLVSTALSPFSAALVLNLLG